MKWMLDHTMEDTVAAVDMEEVGDIAVEDMVEAGEDTVVTQEDTIVHGLEDQVEEEIIIVLEISDKDFIKLKIYILNNKEPIPTG